MDDETVKDIKRTLKDAIETGDWKCVEEVIEIIDDYDGTYDNELSLEDEN